MLLTGSEDGSLRIWELSADAKPAGVVARAHNTRIRGVAPFSPSSRAPEGSGPGLVASASSDGIIRVWNFETLPSDSEGRSARLIALPDDAGLRVQVTWPHKIGKD